jgi:hypothetical protein
MTSKTIEEWRGRTEERLGALVKAVRGGNGEKGLVNEVGELRLLIASYKAYMAMWAGIGTFLGTIFSSIIVAVVVKYFLK